MSYEVFGKIYQQQAGQQPGAEANPNNAQQPPKDDVVDADYTVVE